VIRADAGSTEQGREGLQLLAPLDGAQAPMGALPTLRAYSLHTGFGNGVSCLRSLFSALEIVGVMPLTMSSLKKPRIVSRSNTACVG
jgi:hypothetical protein